MYRTHLFEATKRFNFRVLTWVLTSNHTHLLVTGGDRGTPQISEALQFVHGETAQHYNLSSSGKGSATGLWTAARYLTGSRWEAGIRLHGGTRPLWMRNSPKDTSCENSASGVPRLPWVTGIGWEERH